MVAAVTELAPLRGVAEACAPLGVPRSSYYRTLRPRPRWAGPDVQPPPPVAAPAPGPQPQRG